MANDNGPQLNIVAWLQRSVYAYRRTWDPEIIELGLNKLCEIHVSIVCSLSADVTGEYLAIVKGLVGYVRDHREHIQGSHIKAVTDLYEQVKTDVDVFQECADTLRGLGRVSRDEHFVMHRHLQAAREDVQSIKEQFPD